MERNNTGLGNSGEWNSGNRNSGIRNIGNENSGNRNSGNGNSGYRNSGNWNIGDWNSGKCNSGDGNSGDWNSGDWNIGYFNTGTPNKIQVFNQWVEMTQEEFEYKYNIYAYIPLNKWIDYGDMTEKEIKDFPKAKKMDGYLKTLEFKEACQIWWNENPKRHKDFLELPNFSSDIFKEITGIDTEVKDEKMEEAMQLLKDNGYKITK